MDKTLQVLGCLDESRLSNKYLVTISVCPIVPTATLLQVLGIVACLEM